MRKLYPAIRTEPNMREELQRTFDGDFPEISKRQWGVLRSMRRDTNDKLIKCPCVDSITKEPDLDTYCPICGGEGNLWDENFMPLYKEIIRSDVGLAAKEDLIKPGLVNIQIITFYTTWEQDITKEDKVIELKLRPDGKAVIPYRRKRIYRIGTPIDLRSDNGKLEYWKLDCYEEDRKFLNGANL